MILKNLTRALVVKQYGFGGNFSLFRFLLFYKEQKFVFYFSINIIWLCFILWLYHILHNNQCRLLHQVMTSPSQTNIFAWCGSNQLWSCNSMHFSTVLSKKINKSQFGSIFLFSCYLIRTYYFSVQVLSFEMLKWKWKWNKWCPRWMKGTNKMLLLHAIIKYFSSNKIFFLKIIR